MVNDFTSILMAWVVDHRVRYSYPPQEQDGHNVHLRLSFATEHAPRRRAYLGTPSSAIPT